jgi:multidrug resistance efflux pump
MRNLTPWLAVFTASLGTIAGCQPSVDQAKADLCRALADYDQAVASLQRIQGNATVGQLKDAHKAVEQATQRANEAAEKYQKAEIREVKDSYQQLQRKINSIPDKATLAQAQQSIQPDVQNLKAALQRTRTQVQCP